MKVQATRPGYYNHLRKAEGEVFEIEDTMLTKKKALIIAKKRTAHLVEGDPAEARSRCKDIEEELLSKPVAFSPRWMVQVDEDTPDGVFEPAVPATPVAVTSPNATGVRQASHGAQFDERGAPRQGRPDAPPTAVDGVTPPQNAVAELEDPRGPAPDPKAEATEPATEKASKGKGTGDADKI